MAGTIGGESTSSGAASSGTSSGPGETTSQVVTTGGESGEPALVDSFERGPARVYWMAGATLYGARELRRVDIGAGVLSPSEVVVEAPVDGLLKWIRTSPTSRWLAVDGQDAGKGRLWVVDSASAVATPAALQPDVVEILWAEFSPGEEWLSFVGGPVGGPYALHVCGVAGDGSCDAQPIHPPLPPMGTVLDRRPWYSNEGTWIAYSADIDGAGGVDVLLASPPLPGEAAVIASFADPWTDVGWLKFAADEQVVYFEADVAADDQYQFFAVDLAVVPPGPPVPLHDPIGVQSHGRLAPDLGGLALWTGSDGVGDLWHVAIDGLVGGTPKLLNTTTPGQVWFEDFVWSNDSARVAFVADALHVVAVAAPNPGEISAPATGIQYVAFTPDDMHVLYTAFTADESGWELFRAGVESPGSAIRLSDPVLPGGVVYIDWLWSSDAMRLLFHAKRSGPEPRELFLVDLVDDPPSAATRLNDPPPPQGFVTATKFSGDGQRVFYIAYSTHDSAGLYTVELGPDGAAAAPTEIAAPEEDVGMYVLIPLSP